MTKVIWSPCCACGVFSPCSTSSGGKVTHFNHPDRCYGFTGVKCKEGEKMKQDNGQNGVEGLTEVLVMT